LIGHPADPAAITKRFYTMGNFSKFVRPGWTRIDASGGASANISASAYRNPASGDFALVVINDSGGDLPFAATLTGMHADTVTPWVTSAALNLQAQAPIAVTANRFSTTISYGVTTFVGTSDGIFADGFQ
jgi:glucuronoarabinoxylan endo-1,4-beta-xylanase